MLLAGREERKYAALLFGCLLAMGTGTISAVTLISKSRSEHGLGLGPTWVAAQIVTPAVLQLFVPTLMPMAERLFGESLRMLRFVIVLAGLVSGASALAYVARSAPLLVALLVTQTVLNSTVMALATAAVLTRLERAESRLYPLRAFGTLGYIVAGLAVAYALKPISAGPLAAAGVIWLVLAALLPRLLPAGGPTPAALSRGMPTGLWSAARDVGLSLLLLAASGNLLNAFYLAYANLFLDELPGVTRASAVQILAQALELILLPLVPYLIQRGMQRSLFVLGPLSWTIVFAGFVAASGHSWRWVLVSLPFQGFNCTFQVASAIAVSRRVDAESRPRMQTVLAAFQSAGVLIGYVLVSILSRLFLVPGHRLWTYYWAFPLVCGVFLTLAAVRLSLLDSHNPPRREPAGV